MMESPAFYEAYKHSLLHLQSVILDTFPIKKYIVDAETTSQHPKYLKPITKKLDFSVLRNSTSDDSSSNAKFKAKPLDFENWPTANDLNLDTSQYEAFQKALTQELTIIQGPPGTGKTFIGIQIVKLLLSNMWLFNSPILIVSYTNHSLDQALEQIFYFVTKQICSGNEMEAEQMILRVGGGSKSKIVEPLTLAYKCEKLEEKELLQKKLNNLNKLLNSIKHLNFQDLLLNQGILDFGKLPSGILKRLTTDEKSKTKFEEWKNLEQEIKQNPLNWFGIQSKQMSSTNQAHSPNNGRFLINFSQIDISRLLPFLIAIKDQVLLNPLQSNTPINPQLPSTGITIIKNRWEQYFSLTKCVKELVEEMKQRIIILHQEYLKVEHCLPKKKIINLAKVIGMTTTGAVKHKWIVFQTKPKIMIVEEAAHVLEAHVVASLTEHCQQMILIGDHKQLRPLTADNNLATEYKLDVSLMERLVKNGMVQGNQNWSQLKVQHRMRPEIARLISPVIYEELYNHPSVHLYPNVRGCSKNLFFIDHRQPESKDDVDRSYFNEYEVQFLAALVKYFIYGGYYQPHQLTVIAAYSAQKLLLDNELRSDAQCKQVRISTVDGYQGEENDVILLSLVRNNQKNQVGFLETDNRVCVALSRARKGFYMIGNMFILKSKSETWAKVNTILQEMGSIGKSLPLTGSGFQMQPLKIKSPNPGFSTVTDYVQTNLNFQVDEKYPLINNKPSETITCTESIKSRDGGLPIKASQFSSTAKVLSYSECVKSNAKLLQSSSKEIRVVSKNTAKSTLKIQAPSSNNFSINNSPSYSERVKSSVQVPVQQPFRCNSKGTPHSTVNECIKAKLETPPSRTHGSFIITGNRSYSDCVKSVINSKSIAQHPLNGICKIPESSNMTLLKCGHYQELSKQQKKNLSKVKCLTLVEKMFSCGSTQRVPCHQKSINLVCLTNVSEILTCEHKMQ